MSATTTTLATYANVQALNVITLTKKQQAAIAAIRRADTGDVGAMIGSKDKNIRAFGHSLNDAASLQFACENIEKGQFSPACKLVDLWFATTKFGPCEGRKLVDLQKWFDRAAGCVVSTKGEKTKETLMGFLEAVEPIRAAMVEKQTIIAPAPALTAAAATTK